jgi:hypothetical protein
VPTRLLGPPLTQCCGSGMFIPDPDFYPSRIPDLESKNSNKRGEQNLLSYHFLQPLLGQFLKIYRTFYPKNIVNKISKIWVWDPGSEIRDPEKTYSGSRGQKGTGSRIRITALTPPFQNLPLFSWSV